MLIEPLLSPSPLAPPPPDFEQVVADCYNDVFRFALTLTKAEADAADLTQQAFLKFARKGQQLRDHAKIKSWLFTILRNEFTDGYRRKVRVPMVELTIDKRSQDTPTAQQTDGKIALDALKKIDLIYREPLALYYLEGYTYPEIASILQIPIGTVMSRLSRGRTKLRDILRPPQTKKVIGHG